MIENLLFLGNDYTFRIILLGSAILGATSGSLGSFAFARGRSLMGDAVSHATLPGIIIGFVLAGHSMVAMLIGALIIGSLAMIIFLYLIHKTHLKEDSVFGVVLSVFFGAGVVLLSFVQRLPLDNKSGLDTFFFGQAATMLWSDVITMAIFGGIALSIVLLFYKELLLITFDQTYARSLGIPVHVLSAVLTIVMVVAIVIGLQIVGVVLMSALLIAPSASARQWTNNFAHMIVLSGIFGALSGVTGSLISVLLDGIPTGPVIVLSIFSIFVVSIVLSPKRGLLKSICARRYVH